MTIDKMILSDLFEENYALLYRVGRVFLGASAAQAELIEDQIQETFVLAWRHRQKLETHPNPNGWLVETFRRCLMAQCRKRGRERRRQAFSLDRDLHPPVEDPLAPSPESFVQGAEQVALLHRLLGDKDADIFLRYCVWGESARQLAADYNMSESGVRVRVSRLKKKLLANRELFLCVVALLAMGAGIGGL
jgi:RNA polymerase sigma factor (sigma-70 family)